MFKKRIHNVKSKIKIPHPSLPNIPAPLPNFPKNYSHSHDLKNKYISAIKRPISALENQKIPKSNPQ